MAITTFVLGNSGEGKSFSLKHLDPKLVGVINVNNKPLPFRGGHDFKKIATDNAERIKQVLLQSQAPIIVIDDFQYVMGNEYIGGANQKFTGDAAFQRYNIMAWITPNRYLTLLFVKCRTTSAFISSLISKRIMAEARLKPLARCSMTRSS